MVVQKSESMIMYEKSIDEILAHKPKHSARRAGIPVEKVVIAVAAGIVLAAAIITIV